MSMQTGTSDKNYNLVSVLYHTLTAKDTYKQYISDAEEAGDTELAEFFKKVQQQQEELGEQAEELLKQRLG